MSAEPLAQPSLIALIRDIIATGEIDPAVIAQKALGQCDPDMREHAALIGLKYRARQALSNYRTGQKHPTGSDPAFNGGHSPADGSPLSPKWEGVRASTNDPLAWGIPVTGRADGWKLLADCTVTDLRRVADAYMARARQNASYAKRYNTLADEMTRLGVETVRDLPREVLERVVLR